jgi:hypothetical protein
MKVNIRYNLLDDQQKCVSLESNDIDDICKKIRDIFKETHNFVYAETDENLAWTQGDEGAIIVSPKVKDDKSNDAKKGYDNDKRKTST